jgi:hypothetical protein
MVGRTLTAYGCHKPTFFLQNVTRLKSKDWQYWVLYTVVQLVLHNIMDDATRLGVYNFQLHDYSINIHICVSVVHIRKHTAHSFLLKWNGGGIVYPHFWNLFSCIVPVRIFKGMRMFWHQMAWAMHFVPSWGRFHTEWLFVQGWLEQSEVCERKFTGTWQNWTTILMWLEPRSHVEVD